MRKLLMALVFAASAPVIAASVTTTERATVYKYPGHGQRWTVPSGTALNVASEYAGFYKVEPNAAQRAEANVDYVYVCLWNGVIPRDGNTIDPVIKNENGVAVFIEKRWARITPELKAEHLRVGFAAGDSAKILGSIVWYYEVETTNGRGYVRAESVR